MADPVQPENHPEIPWDDYMTLLGMPEGTYGISYNISKTDTEANLPIWRNARRGSGVLRSIVVTVSLMLEWLQQRHIGS